ncbi:MAG: 4-hydroxythreonine-4-phosphate dehydrogenase [Sulfurimonas sp.]|nr:4-hydroxythreonine-4-phosphate dehydrogenase [Sulfurimonas sp.]
MDTLTDLPFIAISVGDLNGVGIEIALKSHAEISKICVPLYCINAAMLSQAASLLNVEIPDDFYLFEVDGDFEIEVGQVSKASGQYSYDSFLAAIKLCKTEEAQALVTMPIHKEAWMQAGLHFVGHTDVLRKRFKTDAIMMLGCEEMYVALFTEHIPLKDVASSIESGKLSTFLLDLFTSLECEKVAVLGLNPHAGDNGVLGNEEKDIKEAIKYVNEKIGREVFIGPIVPDIAFTPSARKNFKYFVAMYHDQGLIPLKALYFDESINVSLNLPIVRTSVDHGTAFDIAYQGRAKNLSYLNAIKSAISFI